MRFVFYRSNIVIKKSYSSSFSDGRLFSLEPVLVSVFPANSSSCTRPKGILAPSFVLVASAAISSSYSVHSGTCLLARSSFGSFVMGLLHKSIVFASCKLSSEHQVSHHSQFWSSEWIGISICMLLGKSWSRLDKLFGSAES